MGNEFFLKKKHLRVRRGTKKRILSQRLKREPPQEPCHALAFKRLIMLWTIVDVHDNNEDGNTSNNKHGNEPRSPLGLCVFDQIRW